MDPYQETYEDYYDYVNDDEYPYGTGATNSGELGSHRSYPYENAAAPRFQHGDNEIYDVGYQQERYEHLPLEQAHVMQSTQSRGPPVILQPSHQQSAQPGVGLESGHRNPFQVDPPLPNSGAQTKNVGSVQLIPASRLPDIYRAMFPFGVFNAVQSTCLSRIVEGDENMVICSPTGSGKTTLFELAIIRFLETRENDDSRCIYIAPTKALCSEKYRDWSQKFQSIGINCCEMTGDTESYGRGAWAEAKNAKIIITTPEKLDSLSRNWGDHEVIFSTIKLTCVDEVHLLGESRGSTLEACLSRMKIRTDSRFILVSATVPNASDIASWIGSRNGGGPAQCLKFGDEYRPCKLTKHVYGVTRNTANSFQFDRALDAELFRIIQKHCNGKPTLVFCSTRKGVISTAERIVKDYKGAQKKKNSLPWYSFGENWTFSHPSLRELAENGVGIHHAGMSMEDRRLTEDGFLGGRLFVVVATSTLAVGVNLPCHTVIIKGTEMWDGIRSREYSDIDVVQMMGRAGRPQFDTEGVAIIMCDIQQKFKYLQMGANLSTLESCLHLSLPEHLNSEIVLGSVTDLGSAREWLRNTFLFKRIQINPQHYGIAKANAVQTWETYFDALVFEALESLKTNRLMTDEVNGRMSATEFGVIASRAYVKQASMNLIIGLPEIATKKDLLLTISQAAEFQDIRLRQGERGIYNKLCQHPDIRFELKKVDKPHEKIFVLLQAILGGIPLSAPEYKNSDSLLQMEAVTVYKHAVRLMRCAVEAAIIRRGGGLLKHSLELHRCLRAKAWEDRPIVLRQLEGIGDKSIQALAAHGITSITKLRNVKPHQIETWLNRKPPFGKVLLASVDTFPRCSVSITDLGIQKQTAANRPVISSLEIRCSAEVAMAFKTTGPRSRPGTVSILTCTSDLAFLDYRRISIKALMQGEKTFKVLVELNKPSQLVEVHMSPDAYAGVAVIQTHRPNIHPKKFPVPNTRPQFEQKIFQGEAREENIGPMRTLRPLSQEYLPSIIPTVEDQVLSPSISRSGHEALSNGRYACNHRCQDKSSCHHRCCQEGLAKPPQPSVSKKKLTLSKSKPLSGSPSNVSHENLPSKKRPSDVLKSKLPKQQESLLQQLDAIHKTTNKKTKFKDGLRLTMADSRQPKDINISDDESIPDVEQLLHKHDRNGASSHKDEFGFSDEEMEAAMANLPFSKLTPVENVRKRPRSSEDDEQEPKNKRLKMGAPKKKPKQKRDQSKESLLVIELSSSSESSPVSVSAKRGVFRRSPKKISDAGPLFLPSSSPILKDLVRLSQTVVEPPIEEDDMDFQLDMSLFELEVKGDAPVALYKPDEGPKSFLTLSTIASLPQELPKAHGERKEESMAEEKERKSMFEELGDDDGFDNFFNGIDIV